MKTKKVLVSALAFSLAMGAIVSCSSDNGGQKLPPIGGYNSADEVAKADLLAYWPLDGDGQESISKTSPSNSVGATYVESMKGKALMLNAGYLNFPSIANLNVQGGSITVSCWAKLSNTKQTPDGTSHISPIISFTGGPNLNIGNLSIFGNTHGLTTSDSIQMKAEFHFKKADGTDFGGDCVNVIKHEDWMDNTHTVAPNKIGGQWAHIVYVYDGATATNRMYVNGVKISNSAWEVRNNGDAMAMMFFTPTHPIIGALATVVDGTNTDTWNAAMTGGVDEIRVWKTVLPQSDINALYELEKAGR